MENKAAPRKSAARGLRVVSIAALAGVLAMLACFPASSPAKGRSFVARDGKIHACYRVKGKPKGMVRVVRGKGHRCRRGERRMAWLASAGPGAIGAQGQSGGSGGSSDASAADENAALKAQIGNMTLRIAALEGLLDGIAKGDLSGALSRVNVLEGVLDNVDNEGLLNAVQAAPLVEEVCTQTEELTGRSNALLGFLDTIDALNVLSLPTVLPTFDTCPTP